MLLFVGFRHPGEIIAPAFFKEVLYVDYGFLSLVPPVLAIALAVLTKNIIVSLFVAVFVSSVILADWNPFLGLTRMIHDYMFNAVAEDINMQALFMMVVIGGFVALLTKSGGASAFTSAVTRRIDTRAKCETGIWLGGLAIWFTDNGNSLIVGPIFEALAEKLRVSREKFSYILDCTTSPICALIPIIGWGVYTMSLIQPELDKAGITTSTDLSVFMAAIPLNFYAVLTLFMAGLMAVTQWDYGPMLRAQNRAMKAGETIRAGGTPMRAEAQADDLPAGVTPKIYTMVVPLVVLLTVMFSYLTYKGLWHTKVAGSEIRTGVAAGFMVGTIVLIVICVLEKIFSFNRCLSIISGGWANMMFMCVVLVLSWSLSGVSSAMGTAGYLLRVTEGWLNPSILPLLLFLIGAIMSFATGTSWGTMAVLFPIGLPMAISLNVSLPLTSAAIISGGLYGDHCSPISDTTILASIGAASDHIDHFETQMPYGTTCAAISGVLFLVAGWLPSAIMLVLGAVALTATVYVLHKASVRKIGQIRVPGGEAGKNL
ncbi:Na+/H+ antiporter NhaC family protein [uncultured Fretibacterium sp.]|uniref:Na+/H+ antiporter NhaC family protein n=1 Tax=uncultured Fretibacterium sp. TaxID=1678694 RepID=UPI002608E8C0|nr:Na+/H+ antiporter NhaC family protein [uncultured Fretibacterium sp.]